MLKKKKIRTILWYFQRLDALLILLVLATVPLFVLVALGAVQLLQHIQSGGTLFSKPDVGGFDVYAQMWAIASMVLFILVGWSIWGIYQRRHLDQIRLRRSEMKYRSIINHAGEAIFMLDADGLILEWNKATERLFGVPRRNVLGRPFREIHLCYSVEIEKAMSDARRLKRSISLEFPLRRRGRQEIGQISLTVSRNIRYSDRRRRRMRMRAPGLVDQDTYVVIARDVTHERQLETRMSETEKLAGIGQFAAGIAHQLNTPLGSILLSAQMLEDVIKNEDDVEDLQRIIRQTEQCRTIIKGLLNFSRPSGRSRSRTSLSEVIRETLYLMDKTIRAKNVEIDLNLESEGIVYGNRNELEQVFVNLLSNALDALKTGGRIRISLRDLATREIEVLFEDTGEGIPEDLRDQIFLPFYTTKDYGKGTGLGLPIVSRIVHEHGGHIEIAEGEGASFLMSFPVFRQGMETPAGGGLLDDDMPDDAPGGEARP